MKRIKIGKQLLLIGLLLLTLITNSMSVALGQEPGATATDPVYLPLVANDATASTKPSGANQIIIHYKDSDQAAFQAKALQVAAMSEAAGVTLDYVRELADRSVVVRLPQTLTDAELQPILAKIGQLPEVLVAEPDTRLFAQRVPNDPRYGEQWHYFSPAPGSYGVNLPGAWDITTGAANLVIAVLDTGQLNHADLAGRMVAGYDFITDIPTANDGNGRDADPSDPGDWDALGPSSWHGTHVAGTIGAKSNNGLGVTGINWTSKIQHVRVLGTGGGDSSDVTDAIRWAAGLSVPGAPPNPTPAKVLNLSLAGFGICGIGLQNAIDAAVNAGAVVVVAAGNESTYAHLHTPANCKNVITVAATNRHGDQTIRTNYGTLVEIAAPGGETGILPSPDGVLSTINSGQTTPATDSYEFYSGTSMAAPHVAGIASLLLSVRPTLTPAQVLNIIQTTATPFPAFPTSWCDTEKCGAGVINAAAAVAVAQSGLLPPSHVRAKAPAAGQMQLTWQEHMGDETGFKVERCQGITCTNFIPIATLGANVTSYLNTGLAADTYYRYRVVATRNGANSPASLPITDKSWTAGCTVFHSADLPKAITDFNTVESTLTIPNNFTITDVNVRYLNVTHLMNFHLTGVLVSPSGAQVEFYSGEGSYSGDFSDTTLDDEAETPLMVGVAPYRGSYSTFYPLSAFDGQSSAGIWKMRINDWIEGYEGMLNGWSLELCGSGGGSDLIFEDGFESGGFGSWSSTSTLDGGDLGVDGVSALVGTWGMGIRIDDTRALYVTSDSPNAEARYRARFHFDPNGLVLPNALSHYIFYGYQGTNTVVVQLEFRNYNGAYQLRGAIRQDNSTWNASAWYPVSDAPHTVELDWQAATAPGANNGSLTLWIDGVQKGPFTGIDNDTHRLDRIRLGAIAGLDAGTQGSYYFDAFKSTRTSYIGPNSAGVSAAEVTAADLPANVVEEDLSLDDMGMTEEDGQTGEVEEAPKQQIFLPLIRQ